MFNSRLFSVLKICPGKCPVYRFISTSRILKPKQPRTAEELRQHYEERKQWLLSRNLPEAADPNSVFAVVETDLSEIDVYGFDYDYTLATYKTSVEQLIYDLAKKILVDDLKYPEEILSFEYRADSVIRGLHYDILHGLLMKLDNSARIQPGSVYRGDERLSDAEVLAIYKKRHLPANILDSRRRPRRMVQLADTFSKPTICLLSDLTSWFRRNNFDFVPESVYHDATMAISMAHPVFHKVGQEDPSAILNNSKNEELRKLLERFREAKKSVFVCSNSPFKILDGGMNYMLGPDWQEYFDIVIVNANKPAFFTEVKNGFREYSRQDNRLRWKPVDTLKPKEVYAGGTIFELQNLTGWEPDRAMYFGDHVYADLADLRTTHGWRTAAVIQDLRPELIKIGSDPYKLKVNWSTMLQSMIGQNQDSKSNDDGGESAAILSSWKEELAENHKVLKRIMNERYGSVFRTERTPTFFSGRLFQFSDIYMSHITNLNKYSLEHVFYPRRGALPHEFKSWFV